MKTKFIAKAHLIFLRGNHHNVPVKPIPCSMENMIRVIGNIELLKASDCIIYNTTKYLSPPEVYVHEPIIITGDNLIMDEERSNTSDDDNDGNGILYYEFSILHEGEPADKLLIVHYDTRKNEFTGWCVED